MKTPKPANLSLLQADVPLILHLCVMCFGLMLSLPFLLPFHDQPVPSFYSEALAVLLGTMGIFLSLSATTSLSKVQIPWIASLPLALLVPVALQWTFGYFAYASSAVLLIFFLSWSALLMLAIRLLLQRLGSATLVIRLAWFVLIGSMLNALIGLSQFFDLTPIFAPLMSAHTKGAGVYGNVAQENHFASHLALGLAALIYLRLAMKLRSLWVAPLACLLVSGIFLSGSRSGLIYLLWIAVFFASRLLTDGFSMRRVSTKTIMGLSTSFGLVVAMILTLMLFFSEQFPQFQRYLTYSETLGARLYLWRNAWNMFLDAPILGVGFDAFAYQLVEQIGRDSQVQHWGIDQYAHNIFLQLLAVSGLLGLFAFALPTGLFVWRQWRVSSTQEKIFCHLALGVLLIHSLLEQPLYYAYFLACASVFFACAEDRTWELNFRQGWRYLIVIGLLGVVLVTLKTVADFALLERSFFRTEGTSQADTPSDEERGATLLLLHKNSFFSPIIEAISPESFVPHEAGIKEKLALNQRLMHFAPVAEVEYRQVALLAQDHRIAAAQQRFRTAALAYPAQAEMVAQRLKLLAESEPETYQALAEFAENYLKKSTKP